MELAGLSCAEAVYKTYPCPGYRRVLIACGPGNQGGDGLVAARHLKHFGYAPAVWYPKQKDAPLFHGLIQQLRSLEIPFVDDAQFEEALVGDTDLVLDAVFGFSFHGTPRAPFLAALEAMVCAQKNVPIVSVDIPSSWNVDTGRGASEIAKSFCPDMLVSLTAPKLGVRTFTGKHWLGGRFLYPSIVEKYALSMPLYPGASQVVDITGIEPENDDM
ncbi:hypothetical protein MVES_001439 [Malassezia vespertilionis]|uniref:NAD(P)H-hydrate epimerase n=2 Tax=Malassezia vespertilionis TaxID=2020962 RepID=A0A2N1JD38_9BASI|nr:hypothetical protein MVES_001439 [Malassezia vespertilionis]